MKTSLPTWVSSTVSDWLWLHRWWGMENSFLLSGFNLSDLRDPQESPWNGSGWSLPLISSVCYLWLFTPYPARCPALTRRENWAQMERKRDSILHSFNPPPESQCLYATGFLSRWKYVFCSIIPFYMLLFFVLVENKTTIRLHLKQSSAW